MTSERLDQRLPAARADRVPRGILYMLGATVVFAISNALAKWQIGSYSFAEVLFFRAIVSLIACSVLILPRTGLMVFRTHRLRDHFGRSGTQAVAQSLIVIAFSLMPLGGAIAINFASPLFATLFAALWLKEKVGLARGAALIAGFLGVLLVAAPGADSFRIGALFALGNAVLFGSVTAAVRGMTTTESAETLTMYQMVFLTLFFTLALPVFGFTWPSSIDLTAMLVNGLFNSARAVLVDALAVSRPALGGRTVLLFLDRVGARARLFLLGRHPDFAFAGRLGDRGLLRDVPALA